jgi:hypothetical protein
VAIKRWRADPPSATASRLKPRPTHALDRHAAGTERVFSSPRRAFSEIFYVASGGGHVWVTSSGGLSELTYVPQG